MRSLTDGPVRGVAANGLDLGRGRDTAHATLDNESGARIGFQECTIVLQKRVGPEWVNVEAIPAAGSVSSNAFHVDLIVE